MVRRVSACLVALLCLLALPSVGAVGSSGEESLQTTQATDDSIQTVYGVDIDPDDILLHVELDSDGTGSWQIEYRIRLDDANSSEAFDRHREEIESNPDSYIDEFETDIQATIDNAATATDREMSVADTDVSATVETIPQRYGVIRYTFDWNGFAETTDTGLDAGDALEGIFLTSDTTLMASWPEGYDLAVVSPEPDEYRDRSVIWRGSMHFGTDEPLVSITESIDDDDHDGAPLGEHLSDTDDRFLGQSVIFGALAAIFVGLIGGLYLGYVPNPIATRLSGSESAAVDPNLLSNEEQVLSLLEDNDGRVKQQEVAKTLEWTAAKTSKVIRQMREEGSIETFRIGRENVVTLPDTDLEN